MPDTGKLTKYPGIVNSWILEKNLPPPPHQTSIIANYVLTFVFTPTDETSVKETSQQTETITENHNQSKYRVWSSVPMDTSIQGTMELAWPSYLGRHA